MEQLNSAFTKLNNEIIKCQATNDNCTPFYVLQRCREETQRFANRNQKKMKQKMGNIYVGILIIMIIIIGISTYFATYYSPKVDKWITHAKGCKCNWCTECNKSFPDGYILYTTRDSVTITRIGGDTILCSSKFK